MRADQVDGKIILYGAEIPGIKSLVKIRSGFVFLQTIGE